MVSTDDKALFLYFLALRSSYFNGLYVLGAKVSERHSSADQRLVGTGEGEEAGGGAEQCGDQGGPGEVVFIL